MSDSELRRAAQPNTALCKAPYRPACAGRATLGKAVLKELAVNEIVARLNIEHYRKLLANEADETKRHMIARLLAEEEAKLAGLENQAKN